MSLLQNSNAISEGSIPFAGYSIRFNSANSTYFSRTQGTPTDGRKWSFSFWVKRGNVGNDQMVFSAGSTSNFYMEIGFETSGGGQSDQLVVRGIDTSQYFATVATYASWTYSFRDPSAWFHVCVVVDTTKAVDTDRLAVYVNGQTAIGYQTPYVLYQDLVLPIGAAGDYAIGRRQYGPTDYLDGMLTQVYFVDGQMLAPTDFAETDATTGEWIPKSYSGTYGNNGFYLPFTVGSSVYALGADESGNGNNWTPNNFSRTIGVDDCWLKDYPINDPSSTQPKGNYCVIDIANPDTVSSATARTVGGNLQTTSVAFQNAIGTVYVSSGKYYWECQYTGGTSGQLVGVYNGSTATTVTIPTTTSVIGVKFDRDAGTLDYTTNGLTWTSIATGLTSGKFAPYVASESYAKVMYVNYGQREFTYSIPTGYKTLCLANIAFPAITQPWNYYNCVKWIGNSISPRNVYGLSFKPDLVWGKPNYAINWWLYDVVRGPGATKVISSSSTMAQDLYNNSGGLTSFNTSGFTVSTGSSSDIWVNGSGTTYYSFNWLASNTTTSNTAGSRGSTVSTNNTSGFSIFGYSGTSAPATVGHGLSVQPKFLFIKNLTNSSDWAAWHIGFGNKVTALNYPYAITNNSWFFNNSTPNSSVVPLGYNISYQDTNYSGNDFIGYAFAEVDGFSKIDSFIGNGSNDGPFIYCGFRPRYLLIKNANSSGHFFVIDVEYNPYNPMKNTFSADYYWYMSGFTYGIDFNANGFKIRDSATDINGSGNTIVYMAIADGPFNTSNAI